MRGEAREMKRKAMCDEKLYRYEKIIQLQFKL